MHGLIKIHMQVNFLLICLKLNKKNILLLSYIIIAYSLQNAGLSGRVFLGRIFKNAAQNDIKPRFLKTGLKGARPSRVLHAGP